MHSRRSFAPAAPPIGQANFFTGELAISVAALEPKPADGDPPVVGVMNLRAMAVVAAAITVERLAPAGERFARAIGAVVVGAGLFLIALATRLG
jgi:hypothetical protein